LTSIPANGYFNAYGNAARKDDHDYVIHLGDYIYESAAAKGERAHQPPRIIFSLWDYRTRHGQYRTDPDLQLLAQDFAWIPTWDDHGTDHPTLHLRGSFSNCGEQRLPTTATEMGSAP